VNVVGNAIVSNRLYAIGDASFGGKLYSIGDASVGGKIYGLSDASFGRRFYGIGDASFGGNVNVVGNAIVSNRLYAIGDASFGGKLYTIGDASFGGNVNVVGNAVVSNRLYGISDASFGGKLYTIGDASFGGNVNVVGNAVVGRRFYGIGDASFGGNAIVSNNATMQNGLSVYGDTTLRGGNVIVSQVLNNMNIQNEYTFDSITGTADANGLYNNGATIRNNTIGANDATFNSASNDFSTLSQGALTLLRLNGLSNNGISNTLTNVPTTTGSYVSFNILMNINAAVSFFITSLQYTQSGTKTWMVYRFDNATTIQVISNGTITYTPITLTTPIQFNTDFWLTIRQSTASPYTTTIYVNGVSVGSTTISDANMNTSLPSPFNINCFFGYLPGNALSAASANIKYKRILTDYSGATDYTNTSGMIQAFNRYPSLYLNNIKFTIEGNSITNKNMFVLGDASFGGKLYGIGDASFGGKLYGIGDASFGGKLYGIGDASFGGNLTIVKNMNVGGSFAPNSIDMGTTGAITCGPINSTTINTRNNNITCGNGNISANRLIFPNTFDNRKLVLYQTADNDFQVYGIGVQTNTMQLMVDSAANSSYVFSGASSSTAKTDFATISNTGISTTALNIGGGNCIIQSSGALTSGTIQTRGNSINCGPITSTTINTAGSTITCGDITSGNILATNRTITCGNITCGNIIAGTNSIGCGPISSTTINTNNNNIACGTGAISCGSITSGAITSTTITTNSNTIDAGTGLLTAGRVRISASANTNRKVVLLQSTDTDTDTFYGIGANSTDKIVRFMGGDSTGSIFSFCAGGTATGSGTEYANINNTSFSIGTTRSITCGAININGTINAGSNSLTCGIITSGNIICGNVNAGANLITCGNISSSVVMSTPRIRVSAGTETNRKIVLSQATDDNGSAFSGFGIISGNVVLTAISGNSFSFRQGTTGDASGTEIARISSAGLITCNGLNANNNAISCGKGTIICGGATINGTINAGTFTLNCGVINSGAINAGGNTLTCGIITSGNIICGNVNAGANLITCGNISSSVVMSTPRIRVSAGTETNRKIVLYQATDDNGSAFSGFGIISGNVVLTAISGNSFSFRQGTTGDAAGTEIARISSTGLTCNEITATTRFKTDSSVINNKIVLWSSGTFFYGIGILNSTMVFNLETDGTDKKYSFCAGATAGQTTASGTEYASIKSSGITASSYNATSDIRLKSNIQTIPSQWENIKLLKPSQYTWTKNSNDDCGFIAQEIYKVYPLLKPAEFKDPKYADTEFPVDASGNPHYYTIDYGKITPYLCKGLQETIHEIEQLRDEIAELKDDKARMSEEIAELKAQMKLVMEHMNPLHAPDVAFHG
jgi:hypothetical protein